MPRLKPSGETPGFRGKGEPVGREPVSEPRSRAKSAGLLFLIASLLSFDALGSSTDLDAWKAQFKEAVTLVSEVNSSYLSSLMDCFCSQLSREGGSSVACAGHDTSKTGLEVVFVSYSGKLERTAVACEDVIEKSLRSKIASSYQRMVDIMARMAPARPIDDPRLAERRGVEARDYISSHPKHTIEARLGTRSVPISSPKLDSDATDRALESYFNFSYETCRTYVGLVSVQKRVAHFPETASARIAWQ